MITSNSIIQRNAANKTYEAFKGNVDVAKAFPINTKNGGLLEIMIFVTTAKSTASLYVTRAGAFSSDPYRPTLLDKEGTPVPNGLFSLKDVGLHTLYVDTLGFENLQISISPGGGSSMANVALSYIVYSEKFSALSLIKPLPNDKEPLKLIKINGTATSGSIVELFNKNENIYAFIDASVYSNPTISSHYFIRLQNSNGDTIYPQSIDLETGEVVSYGNGQVALSESRKTYVDLVRYDAVSMAVVVNSNDPNVSAAVIFKGFSNYLDTKKADEDIIKEPEQILFEGEDFKFVKKSSFTDAWNRLITRSYNRGVYLSNDLANQNKQNIDAGSVVDLEGSNVTRSMLIPYDPLKQLTTKETMINIVLENNSVYHKDANDPASVWAKTKFWEMKGTNRKIPVRTQAEVTENHRFDPTLPDERYLRNSTKVVGANTFIEYQEAPNFTYLGPLCRTKKIVMWGTYLTTGERIGIWATTDGGANYVLIYDFIDKYSLLPNPVNTSSFAAYSGGLTMKKVIVTPPTAADKEPDTPFTYVDQPFTIINKGTETIVVANAHGLKKGDIVLLTGTAQDANWQSLTCDGFDAAGFKQNVYSVKLIDANSFKLETYIGSYDTSLTARHVHSVNESIGGCVISTGEEHPNGWFLYASQKYKDGSTVVDAFNFGKNLVFRLNSSENGIQRACGFLMDNANDPNIIFNCDTSNVNLGALEVEGRTVGLPPKSSNGIWKGKLSNIDDWGKFECIVDVPEPAIWMYQYNGVILAYYQAGGMVISTDNGITWQYFTRGSSAFSGVFNDKIAIAGGYIFEWK